MISAPAVMITLVAAIPAIHYGRRRWLAYQEEQRKDAELMARIERSLGKASNTKHLGRR